MAIAFIPICRNRWIVRRVYTTGATLAIGHIINGEFKQMPGTVRQLTIQDMREMIDAFKKL